VVVLIAQYSDKSGIAYVAAGDTFDQLADLAEVLAASHLITVYETIEGRSSLHEVTAATLTRHATAPKHGGTVEP
jgi:hypothetical protein